jgi:hypothetical protein
MHNGGFFNNRPFFTHYIELKTFVKVVGGTYDLIIVNELATLS